VSTVETLDAFPPGRWVEVAVHGKVADGRGQSGHVIWGADSGIRTSIAQNGADRIGRIAGRQDRTL
jgi:hypothetical protein